MATATMAKDVCTLPKLSLKLGVSLDRLRREFKRNPDLARLARQAGPTTFIEDCDLDRVREVLDVK